MSHLPSAIDTQVLFYPEYLKEECLQEKSKHFFQELNFQGSNSLGNCALVRAREPNCQVEISTWIQSTGSGKKYFPPQHSSKLRKSQRAPVRIPLMFLISQMAEWVLHQKRLLLLHKCSVRTCSSLSIYFNCRENFGINNACNCKRKIPSLSLRLHSHSSSRLFSLRDISFAPLLPSFCF